MDPVDNTPGPEQNELPRSVNPAPSEQPPAARISLDGFSKVLLVTVAVGIWVLVLQNVGILPVSQQVEVANTVRVRGDVDVSGSVSVDNTVDMNIAEINGHRDVFFNNYSSEPNKYYRLPIVNQ